MRRNLCSRDHHGQNHVNITLCDEMIGSGLPNIHASRRKIA